MARIPLVTRDQVADKDKPAYDAFMQARAGPAWDADVNEG